MLSTMDNMARNTGRDVKLVKKPLVSIVMPIYNSEKYLDDCLNSIKEQTYTNIEVIMVDDGSTDSSASICQMYASRDPRFTYIGQKNAGVSAARNTGLMRARGEYICFSDSDDILHCDMIRVHVEKILESGCQIGVSTYRVFKDKSHIKNNEPIKTDLADTSILDDQDAVIAMLKDAKYSGYTWNKIFKSSLIKNDDGLIIGFEKDLHMCEDLYFCSLLMKKAGKVAFYDQDLYFYYENLNGITSGRYSKKLFTQLRAIEMISDLYKENHKVEKEISRVMCQVTISHYSRMIKARIKDRQIENAYRENLRRYYQGLCHPSVNSKDKLLGWMIKSLPRDVYRMIYSLYAKLF